MKFREVIWLAISGTGMRSQKENKQKKEYELLTHTNVYASHIKI